MPWRLTKFSLVTSPTGKGVILIGGLRVNDNEKLYGPYGTYDLTINGSYSDAIFELSPDVSNSITNLKWTILKPRLTHPRSGLVAFPINKEVFNNLSKDYSNCYVDGAYQGRNPGRKKLKTKFWMYDTFDISVFLKVFVSSVLIFISYYIYGTFKYMFN